MSTKTDATRMVGLMATIARERKRRGAPEKPRPTTVTAGVRPATQLASGSPAVIDHFRVFRANAIFDRFGHSMGSIVVDRALYVSGPKLSDDEMLPYESLRDAFGATGPSAPKEEDGGT